MSCIDQLNSQPHCRHSSNHGNGYEYSLLDDRGHPPIDLPNPAKHFCFHHPRRFDCSLSGLGYLPQRPATRTSTPVQSFGFSILG